MILSNLSTEEREALSKFLASTAYLYKELGPVGNSPLNENILEVAINALLDFCEESQR